MIPKLPDATALRQRADQTESKLPAPTPPPLGQHVEPDQDKGAAKARALPYQALADMQLRAGQLAVQMFNRGTQTVNLALYALHALADEDQRFDVNPGGSASATVAPVAVTGAYEVELHGPNGFVRLASGSVLSSEAGVEAALGLLDAHGDHPKLKLTLSNHTAHPQTLIVSGLHDDARRFDLAAHATDAAELDPLDENHGWYALTVTVQGAAAYERQFSGHLENGHPSRAPPPATTTRRLQRLPRSSTRDSRVEVGDLRSDRALRAFGGEAMQHSTGRVSLERRTTLTIRLRWCAARSERSEGLLRHDRSGGSYLPS